MKEETQKTRKHKNVFIPFKFVHLFYKYFYKLNNFKKKIVNLKE